AEEMPTARFFAPSDPQSKNVTRRGKKGRTHEITGSAKTDNPITSYCTPVVLKRCLAMATAAPVQPDAPRRGIKALLARHPLVFYFIIAYAFTWLAAWLPFVLSEDGAGLLPYRSPLGLYGTILLASFVGPSLSAFILSGITEGREGVGRLLRQLVLWRMGFRWYLFALIGLPAIILLSVIFLPGVLASFKGLASVAPLPMLGLFVYIFFLGVPLGEEPGWRGF